MSRKRKKLREISKSRNILKDSDELDFLDNLKIELTNSVLDPRINLTNFIKVDSTEVFLEVCIRQFVLHRFIGIDFNKEILYCLSNKKRKVCHPLPRNWQDIICNFGIRINKPICSLLWFYQMIKLWFYAFYEFLFQTISSLIIILFEKNCSQKKYIYFDSLTPSNIPNKSGKYDYGILSWYLNYNGSSGIDYFAHSCGSRSEIILNGKIKVKYIKRPILPPLNLRLLISFVIYSIVRLIFSIFFLFKGRWWNVILLRDSLISKIIKLNKGKGIGEQYLFHNSNWIYRPLWTYTIEKYNKKIFFYFYSTNIEKFKKLNKPNRVTSSWNLVTWPNYLLWDTFQTEFIKNVSNYPLKYKIVGPISFTCFDINDLVLPENFIAVFDVQPVRTTYYDSLGLDQDYYIPEIANLFLYNVFQSISTFNITIVFKRKRNIGKLAHSKYINTLNKFSKLYKIHEIDPETPAEFIISKAKAVISMPFTSTAMIGKQFGKPSIFFDPSGLVVKDDPAGHGVEIISNITDLNNWLKKLNI